MSIRILLAVLFFACISGANAQNGGQKRNQRPAQEVPKIEKQSISTPPVYFYTFEKSEFIVPYVRIEHAANGVGAIYFRKKFTEEGYSIPFELSQLTVGVLKDHWVNLDFLNSSENYQSERNYAHLGKMSLKMVLDGKQRVAEFNWTENPEAKALTDEYKKIGYQYIWMFDMEVASKNQQLETPAIMKQLEVYLRRGEISDPQEMLPYLEKLGNDERLPLIARNHAKRLAASIGKKSANN